MASKHRDIGLKFRYRSTPNTRRVTKNVGFFGEGGGYHIYIYIYIIRKMDLVPTVQVASETPVPVKSAATGQD